MTDRDEDKDDYLADYFARSRTPEGGASPSILTGIDPEYHPALDRDQGGLRDALRRDEESPNPYAGWGSEAPTPAPSAAPTTDPAPAAWGAPGPSYGVPSAPYATPAPAEQPTPAATAPSWGTPSGRPQGPPPATQHWQPAPAPWQPAPRRRGLGAMVWSIMALVVIGGVILGLVMASKDPGRPSPTATGSAASSTPPAPGPPAAAVPTLWTLAPGALSPDAHRWAPPDFLDSVSQSSIMMPRIGSNWLVATRDEFGGQEGRTVVAAVSPSDGAVVWQTEFPDPTMCTVAATGTITCAHDSSLFDLDPATGERGPDRPLGVKNVVGLHVSPDGPVVLHGSGGVRAEMSLLGPDGLPVWTVDVKSLDPDSLMDGRGVGNEQYDGVYAPGWIDLPGAVVLTSMDRLSVVVDAATGAPTTPGRSCQPIRVDGGVLCNSPLRLLGDGARSVWDKDLVAPVYAYQPAQWYPMVQDYTNNDYRVIDPATGALGVTVDLPYGPFYQGLGGPSMPLVWNEDDQTLTRLDLSTGTRVWTSALQAPEDHVSISAACPVDDRIVLDMNGGSWLLDATDGAVLDRWDTSFGRLRCVDGLAVQATSEELSVLDVG